MEYQFEYQFDKVIIDKIKNDTYGNPVFVCYGLNKAYAGSFIKFYVKSYKINSGVFNNVCVKTKNKHGKDWCVQSNVLI